MITGFSSKYVIPKISNMFFPPFYKGGQSKDAQFMAVSLEDNSTGISYVLLSDDKMETYAALKPDEYIGQNPEKIALEFGNADPVQEMISLAAINAICQHVIKKANIEVESSTNSMALLSISAGDKIGMVGLFSGLVKTIQEAGADLIVIEKNESLINKNPQLPITLDTSKLNTCNKILCTSTTILNNSLDEILSHCSSDAFVAIVGPTAGYFPDPLFARGVDVVGGRVVKNGKKLMQLLTDGKHWGDTTQRTCFQKKTYNGFI